MKLITAVVRPHALDDVRRAFERHAVLGMTISEVRAPAAAGYATTEVHKGHRETVDLVPAVRVESVVHDDLVDRLLDQLVVNLDHGEGRLAVVAVDLVLRVRTGEMGADAV